MMSESRTQPYTIKLSRELATHLQSVSQKDGLINKQKLLALFTELANNPHPMQANKIQGMPGLYRILFVDKYLVYKVTEKNSEVLILSLVKP